MRTLLLALAASLTFAGCEALDSVLYPKNDASTQDNLESMRNQITDFLPGSRGTPPMKLQQAVKSVPAAETGHHMRNDQVINACTDRKDPTQLRDTGGWAYCGVPDNPNFGTLVVDCTHNDSTGKPWFTR